MSAGNEAQRAAEAEISGAEAKRDEPGNLHWNAGSIRLSCVWCSSQGCHTLSILTSAEWSKHTRTNTPEWLQPQKSLTKINIIYESAEEEEEGEEEEITRDLCKKKKKIYESIANEMS